MIHRIGQYHGYYFAAIAYAIDGDGVTRRHKRGCAVAIGDLRFRRMQREYVVGDGLMAIGNKIIACQNADHARQGARFCAVDAAYVRVRVRRAQHHSVNLPRQIHVITKAAVAG